MPIQADVEHYSRLLLSLDEQLALLRQYNTTYWDSRLTENELTQAFSLEETSRQQRIDDLTVLHVEFGSLRETLEMWWRVIAGEQPRSERKVYDTSSLRLLDFNVRSYSYGINLVRINLVAHWKPQSERKFWDERSLAETRRQAHAAHETLAQLELMSAYGLHPTLMREQNGRDVPYTWLPGIDAFGFAGDKAQALYLWWVQLSEKAEFNARRASYRSGKWATPVILG